MISIKNIEKISLPLHHAPDKVRAQQYMTIQLLCTNCVQHLSKIGSLCMFVRIQPKTQKNVYDSGASLLPCPSSFLAQDHTPYEKMVQKMLHSHQQQTCVQNLSNQLISYVISTKIIEEYYYTWTMALMKYDPYNT